MDDEPVVREVMAAQLAEPLQLLFVVRRAPCNVVNGTNRYSPRPLLRHAQHVN